MLEEKSGISRLGTNSFHSTINDLSIEINDSKLLLKTRLIRSILLVILNLLAIIMFGGFAVIINFLAIEKNKAYFSFSSDRFVFLLVIIIISLVLSIAILKIILIRNQNTRQFNFSRKNWVLNEYIILPIIFVSFLGQILNTNIFYLYTIIGGFVAVENIVFIFIIFNRRIEVAIVKENDLYKITANEIFSFLKQKRIIYSDQLPELFLTLAPVTRTSRQTAMELHNRRLFRYEWLSLEEAKNYSYEKNEFILTLANGKMELNKTTNVIIGIKVPIQLVEQILDFIKPFATISVTKPVNIQEKDFVNYAVNNPVKMHKTSLKIVLIITLIIVVPVYLLLIVITPFVFYIAITISNLNDKILMFIIGLMLIVTILSPVFWWKVLKRAKLKQEKIIDKYTY